MRFINLLERQERGEITQEDAAEMLGISVRSFERWRDRFTAEGDAGLADRRLGRPSPRRAPQEELERMLGLYRDRYADFTVKHFHEQLVKRHDYVLGYTVTKRSLHVAGLVRPAPKRSAHRKKRPRRPIRGMMLHQDGSRHVWIEGLAAMDLIVTLDDATSEIYAMHLVDEEGTASTFAGLREVVAGHGLFCALYSDRGSHYFHTPKAGEKVSKTQLTQVGRALAQLGIEHIAAYSPEARGRSERVFRTLQDRLPKELRLAGIKTVEAANHWLREHYMTAHNKAFAVAPEQEGSAFVPDRAEGLPPLVHERRASARPGRPALHLHLPFRCRGTGNGQRLRADPARGLDQGDADLSRRVRRDHRARRARRDGARPGRLAWLRRPRCRRNA